MIEQEEQPTHFLTLTSTAPLRESPSHRSEMTSQLLLGETCEWIESTGDFHRVRMVYDGYEGWVQKRQLVPIQFDELSILHSTFLEDPLKVFVDGVPTWAPPGAEVRRKSDADHLVTAGGYQFDFTSAIDRFDSKKILSEGSVVAQSLKYLGVPYLWGGKSCWGIDCSGFVQMVYKVFGLVLPRDAWQQAERGEMVGFLQEVRPGDLAFFDNEAGRITHVGLMLNQHEIIHASANVRIDPIDAHGIIHRQTGERTHQLRMVKRVF